MDPRLKTHRLLTFVQAMSTSKVELEESLSKIENTIGDLSETQDQNVDQLVTESIASIDKIHESLKAFDQLIMKAKSLSGEKK